METVIIEGKRDTPGIILDPAKHTIKITGSSYPENAILVYSPVFEWIDELARDFPELYCEFYLNYINSSTKKILYEILMLLEDIHDEKKNDIKIKWYYDANDDDMYEVGEEFEELVEIPFEVVEK